MVFETAPGGYLTVFIDTVVYLQNCTAVSFAITISYVNNLPVLWYTRVFSFCDRGIWIQIQGLQAPHIIAEGQVRSVMLL